MKLRSFSLLALAFASAPLLPVACGGGNDNLPPPPPAPGPRVPPSASASASTNTNVPDAAPPPPAAPPVLLVMGTASPDPAAPLPIVKIAAPTSGQIVPQDKAGDFQVKLDVKNWQTATGSSHVHLVLDNKPYKPIYDTKAPIKLSDLSADPLTEGEHTLVAFASRMNHESVKTKDAIAMLSFFVGKKGDPKTDLKKPMLIYSRPKGEYKGDNASHLLVDFQLANVTLAEGKENVHITVTGPGVDKALEAKVEKFGAPWYLDNLQNGQYTVKAELDGADGKMLPGPWNSTTRTITINRDAPADPMPGMNMGAADAGAAPPAVDAGKPAPAPANKDAGAKK